MNQKNSLGLDICFQDLKNPIELFKNWMNDGNHYYHNFRCPIPFSLEENYEFNFINSQEIIRGESFGASLHDDYFLENNYIPESLLEDENKTYAVHFDTFEFSNYL